MILLGREKNYKANVTNLSEIRDETSENEEKQEGNSLQSIGQKLE